MDPANREALPFFIFIMVMSISVMFWNVQGAGASEFRLSFGAIIQCYKPSMVVIF